MYAILIPKFNVPISTGDEAAVNRGKDIADLLCGRITDNTQFRTYDTDSIIVGNSVIREVLWESYSTAASGDFSITMRNKGINNRDIYSKLRRVGTASQQFANEYNLHGGIGFDVSTNLLTNQVLGNNHFVKFNVNNILHISLSNSHIFMYDTALHYINGLFERNLYPYDADEQEGCALFLYRYTNSTSSRTINTGLVALNKFNAKAGTFVGSFFADLKYSIDFPAVLTRDINGNQALPLIPMYTRDYVNGWAGGNISEYSEVYRTTDNFGNIGDIVMVNEQQYRVWKSGILTFLVPEK